MKAYSQDVRTLTDEELKTLSEEMNEAFVRPNDDGDADWIDSEAEDRYWEMCSEIERRRWEALTPEQQEAEVRARGEFTRAALEVLANNLKLNLLNLPTLDAGFGARVPKIGATITVREPPRWGR